MSGRTISDVHLVVSGRDINDVRLALARLLGLTVVAAVCAIGLTVVCLSVPAVYDDPWGPLPTSEAPAAPAADPWGLLPTSERP